MNKKVVGMMDEQTNEQTMLYPGEIILEVTNLCNLQCRFCHFHGINAVKRRKTGFMADAVWEKIADELDDWHRPCTVFTHGAGEPLLYPSLEKLLLRLSQISGLKKGFMTNGMLLTEKVSHMLVDMQVDTIALSIDGIVPETHDYYRQNADLNQIEKNVMQLIRLKEKAGAACPTFFFNMVGYPEILDQADGFVEKWIPYADTIMVSEFRPVGSRRLWDEADTAPPFQKCPLLYNQMVVSIDGSVGLCCEDINVDVPLGNTKNQQLLSVFNDSLVLKKYRNCHEQGDIRHLGLCSDCHVWGAGIVLETREKQVNGHAVRETRSAAGRFFEKTGT